MHVTDLLAPFAARWAQRVRRELDLVPHPLDAARQFVAGPDPDRVLVLGNGPAIGFGVLTQELSLPGHLARRLSAATKRGASVDVLARRGTTAATATALLGQVLVARYGDRVVFKSAVGMAARDVPRSVAPCDRTIRQRGALVLGDLQGEAIAADGWRFYAGHPLESQEGYRIGALCLLDTRPHEPLSIDRVTLAEVAGRIEAQLRAEIAGSPDSDRAAEQDVGSRSPVAAG